MLKRKKENITVSNPMKGKAMQLLGGALIVVGIFTDFSISVIGAIIFGIGCFKHWWFNA